jgi:hypothetical protein
MMTWDGPNISYRLEQIIRLSVADERFVYLRDHRVREPFRYKPLHPTSGPIRGG